MSKQFKIVLVGDNELSIVYPFTTEIQNLNESLKFSVYNAYHVSGDAKAELTKHFERVYKKEDELNYKLTLSQFIKFIFNGSNSIKYFKALTKGIITGNLKKETNFIFSKYKYLLFWKNEIAKYDIVHHHTLFEPQLELIRISKDLKKKIVVSFWGSDLLSTDNAAKIEQQRNLLKLADIVTVQTDEMRNVVSDKFGKDIADKTVSVLFGIPEKNLNQILAFKRNDRKDHQVQTIQIGYNSSPAQNHLKIIDSLNNLDPETKRKIKLLLPMGYGDGSVDYVNTVKSSFTAGFNEIEINTSYLSRSEYLERSAGVDVLINLPETDAGNASLYEALLLGTKVIVGSWLPYSEFKKFEVPLYSIDTFEQLPSALTSVLNSDYAQSQKIQQSVFNMISYTTVAKRWIELYNHLLKS